MEQMMRQQNKDEYSRSTLEAEIEEKRKKENYRNFYSDLHQKQQKKEQAFHEYMRQVEMSKHQAQSQWKKKYETIGAEPMATPTLRSNKSMVAPWEGSVWNSDKWKKEQAITNEILRKQVREKDELKKAKQNSGSEEASQINTRVSTLCKFRIMYS